MDRNQWSRRGFFGLAAGTCAAGVGPGRAAADDAPAGRLAYCRQVPLGQPCDVVVCGGGPSGLAAALAARRGGLDVLLVEAAGQLGGMGVSGMVSHWLGGRSGDCRRWVVGGLFRSMAEEAARHGLALIPPTRSPYQPHGWYPGLAHGIPFDPFAMAAYLDQRVAAAGVRVLLLTEALDVQLQGQRISHVVLSNKSGLAAVPARAVIDATGDADVAARSGCCVQKGRQEDNLMTPATLQFHVSGVDQEVLSEYIHQHKAPRFRQLIRQLREAGEWTFPYEIFISVQLDEPGTMMINTSRLCDVDGTDGASKTAGMVRGRAETQQLFALMRKHFPGFANARIKAVAPLLGVRETRRIEGRFVLGVADLNAGKQFEDTIGLSSYGWDLPDPKRPSHNPAHGKKRPVTPIPYRVMVPQPVENLLCPGRAISVQREVLGPLRVMAPCMAMGEAAGEAAAQAVQRNVALAEVDTAALRDALRKQGAILDETALPECRTTT